MPSVPSWLANTLEKVSTKYYHPVSITHIEYLEPNLKLVRFEGDINDKSFIAGNVIEFRISATDFRHYTPSYYDSDNHSCEVLFYLHDKGPGSKWANELKVGNKVKLIGPGAKMKYKTDFKNHLVFGDETSLGLMLCMARQSEKQKHELINLIEIDPLNKGWNRLNNIIYVESSPEKPAENAIKWLQITSLNKNTHFYLTGRARSIQNISKYLKSIGIDKSQIQTYPYWAEGKIGL